MKKFILSIIFSLLLIPSLALAQFSGSPFGPVPPDDTAYDATTWNGSLLSPTKNTLRDYFYLFDVDGDGDIEGSSEVYGPAWFGEPSAPQKNDIYDYLHLFDTNDDGVVDNVSGGSMGEQSKSFAIYGALASDDFLLWRTPVAITITHIHGVLLTGTNVVGGVDECDANGANPVAVDADITFDGGLDSDDGGLTNPEVDAGDWVKWHTTSVNVPGYLTVTIYYTID